MKTRLKLLQKTTFISIALTLALAASPVTHAQPDKNWWADRYQHKIDSDPKATRSAVKKHRQEVKENKARHQLAHHRTKELKHDRKHDRNHQNKHDKSHVRYDRHDQRRYDHKPSHHRHHHKDIKKANRWQTVSAFRGRSGRDATRYLNVEDRVKALSIQGTKRSMYIRRAHALLGNGRWIRVEGLEGYVGRGERIKHRLRRDRYVQQVVLEVEPAERKRGYAQLLVHTARSH